MKRKIIWFFGVVLILLLIAVLDDPQAGDSETAKPLNRGDRQLAIDIKQAKNEDYADAFNIGKKVGMQRVGVYINWKDLEPEPNKFDYPYFSAINDFYPANDTSVDITITPINTSIDVRPADLKGRPLDDPEVVARFESAIDKIIVSLPRVEIGSLVIGSEMDAYAGKDESKWKSYVSFYKKVADYVHNKYPGVKVATELTYQGAVSSRYAGELNESSDIIGISYYPLEGNFTVREPKTVKKDFARLLENFKGSKPVYFYQYGYPSSKYVGSSEDKQASFIKETFEAWDLYKSRVKMIDITWLTDMSTAELNTTSKFYRSFDRRFTDFLSSIGLRSYSGREKPAFDQMKKELKARGWK
jgi:hypothetical protein